MIEEGANQVSSTEEILVELKHITSIPTKKNKKDRDRNRVKLLHFDGTGLWVCVKRLEKGTFAWPAGVEVENGKLRLGAEALALLLDGVDLKGAKMRPWYQRE